MKLRSLRNLEWPVIFAVLALVALSWPYMRSASYRAGPDGQGYYTSSPQKQIVWVIAGAALAVVFLVPSYRTLSEVSMLLYGGGLAMLVLVLVLGVEVNGARSWLFLPGGERIQPSELAKITTVFALAHFLAPERKARRMSSLVAALGIAAAPLMLVAAQPDLGSALMFVPAAAAMVFVAGARLRHIAVVAGCIIVMLPVAWLGMNATQRSRITTWLYQGRELTRTERVGQFHHLIQSKIAIGSGGWAGKGLGQGTQNKLNYLSFRNTDFIFAVICEEAGFVGANAIILLYLLLAGAGLNIAHRCREPVGRLLAVGITSLFLVQGLVNIAMTIGLLPIVGVTLPFVSYGGSSTLASFVGISLLLNVGLRRPRVTFSRLELSDVGGEYGGEIG